MPPKKKKSSKEKENGSSSAVPLPATLSKEARDLEAAAEITREKARAVMWREQAGKLESGTLTRTGGRPCRATS